MFQIISHVTGLFGSANSSSCFCFPGDFLSLGPFESPFWEIVFFFFNYYFFLGFLSKCFVFFVVA